MIFRWIEFCGERKNVILILSYLVLSIFLLIITPWHMSNVQQRTGPIINDIILSNLKPLDVSIYIMLVLYGIIFSCMIWLIRYPSDLLVVIQTFFVTTSLRYLGIYFISLDPPVEIIPLKDPFLAILVYSEKVITKDLFFSGHAEFAMLAFLAVRHTAAKIFYLVALITLSGLLLVQHVHYTVDILGAIVVTWFVFSFFNKRKPIPSIASNDFKIHA